MQLPSGQLLIGKTPTRDTTHLDVALSQRLPRAGTLAFRQM